MRALTYFFLAATFVGSARAQNPQQPEPEWKAKVTVVDESGLPVPEADVTVGWYITPPPDQSIATTAEHGKTDTNGVFAASGRSRSVDLFFGAVKDGYYKTHLDYEIGVPGQYPLERRSPSPVLILKMIGKPIPMYAMRVETKVPTETETIGFDLIIGDWVTPFGKGKTGDFLISAHRKVSSPREYEADLKLKFPGNGDGIIFIPATPKSGSELETPRIAAESGYVREYSWHYSNISSPTPGSGYFLRVRTTLDENGNVQKALYGKIRGDFRFYVGTKAPSPGIGFDYYLNPTVNDHNLEFDPRQNLIKGLKPAEEVKQP